MAEDTELKQQLTAELPVGSAGGKEVSTGSFPFDAWTFNDPHATTNPILRLKDPWRLSAWPPTKVVSSENYTITDIDGYEIIAVTTAASDRTITLPTLADNQGRVLTIVKVDSGAGEVIVDGEGAETLGGFASLYLGKQYDFITLFGSAASWLRASGAIQPVAGEPSVGTYHPRATDPTVWDISDIGAYNPATPYTWDLSSLIEVGTKAVEICFVLFRIAGSPCDGIEGQMWDYDMGVSPGTKLYGPRGLHVRASRSAATAVTNNYSHGANDGMIVIGSSRKLYIAMQNLGYELYAMFKGYYI